MATATALAPDLVRAADVTAVRVWPSQSYTRVTLELRHALHFESFTLSNPDRVVLDIHDTQLDPELRRLVSRVMPNDPYIAGVTIGQFRADRMRLVFRLKQPVRPESFLLPPVDRYRHRLVLDLYSSRPPDPLELLIAQQDAAWRKRAVEAEGLQALPPDADEIARLAAGERARQAAGAARQQREQSAPAAEVAVARRTAPSARPLSRRTVVVAIDPGHGGEDPGAIGPAGTLEKTITLAVARRLQGLIAQEPGMRGFLTRDEDYFVSLNERVARSRAVGADLFISIHADAVDRPGPKGSSVYVLSERGASSVEARWLATRENRADRVGGLNLSTANRDVRALLMEMYTSAQIRDSRLLAGLVLEQLSGMGPLHKASVEEAGFAVLKAPDVPSILVETAFISNPQEERLLRLPSRQQDIAEAVLNGVRAYFTLNPPEPVRPRPGIPAPRMAGNKPLT